MGEALLYGALGASALGLGGLLTLTLRPSKRIIGWVLAFGAGALVSAVAYELVLEALLDEHLVELAVGLAAGALTFYLGDTWIERRGGGRRKGMERHKGEGNALALFLGALLDGIPESFIVGITIQTEGEVGLAFLAAVFISNLPEGMASSNGFRLAGWPVARINGMWLGVMFVSAASALLGYTLVGEMAGTEAILIQGFAAGALLTMIADTMIPEALKESGPTVGLFTTFGFAVAITIASFE